MLNRLSRRRTLAALAAGGTSAWLPDALFAQSSQVTAAGSAAKWPVATIKFMVPAPAGGGVDVFCRRLCDRISTHLGIHVIIDNRTGAGGLIGAHALANAPADGGHFGYLHAGMMTLQAMGAKLDIENDFTPVAPRYSASQFVIAVNAESPHQTLPDLLKAIAANPGKFNYGSGGVGTPGHMTFEQLRARAGNLDLVYVPFKGAIDAVNAVAAKNLDFVSGLLSSVTGQVRAGRLRALAVSGEQRSPLLPAVPTIAESGYAGFSVVSWAGIFGPAKLPAALTSALRDVLMRIAAETEFQAFIATLGSESRSAEAQQGFAAWYRHALAAETALVGKLGLKLP